jgi:5-methylcytosine-specific restriction endonuclease McrA
LRNAVFERDKGRCQYCRLAQTGHGATFHIDHICPRSRGGPTMLDNLVLQCPNCSLRKSDKVVADDPDTGQSVPLFHPFDAH